MAFNVSSLEFMKKSNKMNKDENFAFGFVLGTISMASVTLKSSDLNEQEVEEAIKDIFTKDETIDIWNKISVELELDTRPLYEILPDFLN